MNHEQPNNERYGKYGNAFGETVLISSPPSRSQMFSKPQSGFGGWADEKIKTAREAAPIIEPEKISFTTFDNISFNISLIPCSQYVVCAAQATLNLAPGLAPQLYIPPVTP